MPFIIKTQKGYIKRTSHFGQFHGEIVLTDDRDDAFRFTRKSDALRRAQVTWSRTKPADNTHHWNAREGRDLKKFGETLVCSIEEV